MFTINSRKFDGQIHRSWNCELIEQTDSLLILKGIFKTEVNHSQIGVIRRNTISMEYFWLDEWFNIFKFESAAGNLLGFYCNVNLPPTVSGNVLDFIDLDLDIFVDAKFNIKILDEDEFILNSEKYNYSPEVVQKARETLKKLIFLVNERDFPFNISS